MGTKKEAITIYFIISIVILIIFVSAGIFIKDKILEKMPKKTEEEKKITKETKDPSKAMASAIFKFAGILALLLVVITVIYKTIGRQRS